MAAVTKINWLIRILVLSISLTLFAGVETDTFAGKKKPVKTKVVPKVKPKTKNDIPKPVVDDTPINPKKPKVNSAGKKKKPGKPYKTPSKKPKKRK